MSMPSKGVEPFKLFKPLTSYTDPLVMYKYTELVNHDSRNEQLPTTARTACKYSTYDVRLSCEEGHLQSCNVVPLLCVLCLLCLLCALRVLRGVGRLGLLGCGGCGGWWLALLLGWLAALVGWGYRLSSNE